LRFKKGTGRFGNKGAVRGVARGRKKNGEKEINRQGRRGGKEVGAKGPPAHTLPAERKTVSGRPALTGRPLKGAKKGNSIPHLVRTREDLIPLTVCPRLKLIKNYNRSQKGEGSCPGFKREGDRRRSEAKKNKQRGRGNR